MTQEALLRLALAAVLSYLLVGAVRIYALRRAVLDQPTARSSHQVPTPRGGGLGLVAVVLLMLLAAPAVHLNPPLLSALGGVLVTAILGWLDDHRSLSVRVRLAVHGLAGLLLLPLAASPAGVPAWLGPLAGLWWVFWAVSAINVVNFMDGIDGLIGSQTLIFGLHVAWRGVFGGSASVLGLALAGAAAGFLVWNWTPARIFLGDVGSGTLGYLMVLAGLLLIREGHPSVAVFLPLYPLFLDASVTLARRLHRGEPITRPHRTHFYQTLANGGWGHARVSLLYAGVALVAASIAALPAAPRTLAITAYFVLVPVLGLVVDRRANRLQS